MLLVLLDNRNNIVVRTGRIRARVCGSEPAMIQLKDSDNRVLHYVVGTDEQVGEGEQRRVDFRSFWISL